MNLDALVKKGCRPWAPSPGARDLDVWLEYDVPTAGTFVLDSQSVIFTVLGSADDPVSVWAYTCLTEDDAKALGDQKFGSVDEMARAVDEQFTGHRAVFAVADKLEIWRWTSLDVEEGLIKSAVAFLSQVRESLEQKKTPDAEFQVKLAGVEAAKSELVSA
jgi:hypothetical protein